MGMNLEAVLTLNAAGFLSGLNSASSGLMRFIGATSALTALQTSIRSAVSLGDQMSELGGRLGVTAGKAYILSETFQRNGSDIGSMTAGLEILSKSLTGVSETGESTSRVIEAMGLNGRDLLALPLDKRIEAIGAAFQRLSSQEERAAAAKLLFGRGGGSWLNILGDPEIIKKTTAALGDLPAVLDRSAKRLDALRDRFSDLGNQGKILGATIALQISEPVSKLAKALSSLNSTGFAETLGRNLGTVVAGAAKLVDFLGKIPAAGSAAAIAIEAILIRKILSGVAAMTGLARANAATATSAAAAIPSIVAQTAAISANTAAVTTNIAAKSAGMGANLAGAGIGAKAAGAGRAGLAGILGGPAGIALAIGLPLAEQLGSWLGKITSGANEPTESETAAQDARYNSLREQRANRDNTLNLSAILRSDVDKDAKTKIAKEQERTELDAAKSVADKKALLSKRLIVQESDAAKARQTVDDPKVSLETAKDAAKQWGEKMSEIEETKRAIADVDATGKEQADARRIWNLEQDILKAKVAGDKNATDQAEKRLRIEEIVSKLQREGFSDADAAAEATKTAENELALKNKSEDKKKTQHDQGAIGRVDTADLVRIGGSFSAAPQGPTLSPIARMAAAWHARSPVDQSAGSRFAAQPGADRESSKITRAVESHVQIGKQQLDVMKRFSDIVRGLQPAWGEA